MKEFMEETDKQAEIRQLRRDGLTFAEIGQKLGLSRQRVHQIFNHKYVFTQHPLSFISKGHNYYEKKERVLTHYGGDVCKCVLCGYDNIKALSIDHILGDGAVHRKEITLDIYTWLIKNNFPDGYRTLCMNCQWVTKADNHQVRK